MDKKESMEWREIKGVADIEALMNTFGGFHDSCLKELYLWTEYFVHQDLTMHVSQEDYRVRILFQRQWQNPSAIEMLFEKVIELNILSSPKDYVSIIYNATLILKDGIFYWADGFDWSPEKKEGEASWISAKKIKWRDVSGWMGPELRYYPKPEDC